MEQIKLWKIESDGVMKISKKLLIRNQKSAIRNNLNDYLYLQFKN